MLIYFAVNQEMIEKYSMPVRTQDASTYHWKLTSDRLLCNIIAGSAGQVLDVCDVSKVEKPYAICKADISAASVIDGLRAAVVGDVISGVDVAVVEIMWIK